MARLDIERIGGFAGFGLPGGALRARGTCDTRELSAPSRRSIEAIFAKDAAPAAQGADRFSIRLTLAGHDGPQVIEVPEEAVPAEVLALIKTELD